MFGFGNRETGNAEIAEKEQHNQEIKELLNRDLDRLSNPGYSVEQMEEQRSLRAQIAQELE